MKQTWNHRIIRRTENGKEYYGIHEVYYNEAGKPIACTENSVAIDYKETWADLVWTLDMMRAALGDAVLNYEDFAK